MLRPFTDPTGTGPPLLYSQPFWAPNPSDRAAVYQQVARLIKGKGTSAAAPPQQRRGPQGQKRQRGGPPAGGFPPTPNYSVELMLEAKERARAKGLWHVNRQGKRVLRWYGEAAELDARQKNE
jgi:hypothetical protein